MPNGKGCQLKTKRPSSISRTVDKTKSLKRKAPSTLSDDGPSQTEVAKEALNHLKPIGEISNKMKRGEMYSKWLTEKKKLKKVLKDARRKEAPAKEEEDPDFDIRTQSVEAQFTAKGQKTLENTRDAEETIVSSKDEEVLADEAEDEFSPYFNALLRPKIMITTRPRPSQELFHFINCQMSLFPNSFYWPRRDFELKDIVGFAQNKGFTHLMVLSEKGKKCNGMIVCHLGVPKGVVDAAEDDDDDSDSEGGGDEEEEGEEGEDGSMSESGDDEGKDSKEERVKEDEDENDEDDEEEDSEDDDEEAKAAAAEMEAAKPKVRKGDFPQSCTTPGPTAYFKVSNITLPKGVENHGKSTSHTPELIFNNFNTRLGHRNGRFLGSMFPHEPEFFGRQVVTLHNQRDFVFIRHHRYIFEKGARKIDKGRTRARLQELGPRFTLKMRWIMKGSFDTRFGEYEWFHKRKEMDVSRRKFHM